MKIETRKIKGVERSVAVKLLECDKGFDKTSVSYVIKLPERMEDRISEILKTPVHGSTYIVQDFLFNSLQVTNPDMWDSIGLSMKVSKLKDGILRFSTKGITIINDELNIVDALFFSIFQDISKVGSEEVLEDSIQIVYDTEVLGLAELDALENIDLETISEVHKYILKSVSYIEIEIGRDENKDEVYNNILNSFFAHSTILDTIPDTYILSDESNEDEFITEYDDIIDIN